MFCISFFCSLRFAKLVIRHFAEEAEIQQNAKWNAAIREFSVEPKKNVDNVHRSDVSERYPVALASLSFQPKGDWFI